LPVIVFSIREEVEAVLTTDNKLLLVGDNRQVGACGYECAWSEMALMRLWRDVPTGQ
jgi:hypothetical protein